MQRKGHESEEETGMEGAAGRCTPFLQIGKSVEVPHRGGSAPGLEGEAASGEEAGVGPPPRSTGVASLRSCSHPAVDPRTATSRAASSYAHSLVYSVLLYLSGR